jgi:hypothetical protein
MPSTPSGFTGIGWADAHIERAIADESADLEEIGCHRPAAALRRLGWQLRAMNGPTASASMH